MKTREDQRTKTRRSMTHPVGDLGDLGPGGPGGLGAWWLGTDGGREGALKLGGGGTGGGGRAEFLADLGSTVVDHLFPGGGAAGRTGGDGAAAVKSSPVRSSTPRPAPRQEVTRTVHRRVPLRRLRVGGVGGGALASHRLHGGGLGRTC